MMKNFRSIMTFVSLSVILAACSTALNSCGGQPGGGEQISALADLDSVQIIRSDNARENLPAKQQAVLNVGEGVDVDESGRAILQFADLLTVEVLRDGALTVQEVSLDEQNAAITVFQNGGLLLNDFNAPEEINKRFTVNTEFASISAVGTTFMVYQEPNSPLQWVLALSATPGDLEVTSAGSGVTKDVQTNVARWIAPIGEPSAGVPANMGNVQAWLQQSQAGTNNENFGDIVWPPADVQADLAQITAATPAINPAPGVSYTYQGVNITLGNTGQYTAEDCNLDGIPDIAMKNGNLEMDFRNVLARVKALDVTVLVRSGSGELTVYDPAKQVISSQSALASPSAAQVLTQRHTVPYHYASLSMNDGCFLGFSLTPPTASGQPDAPRAAVEQMEVAADFIRIEAPFDGAVVTNPFTLSGVASIPANLQVLTVLVTVETLDGAVVQSFWSDVPSGGTQAGIFSQPIELDWNLPDQFVIRVQHRPGNGTQVLAEDTVQITVNPEPQSAFRRPPENGEFYAPYMPEAGKGIVIDSDITDWMVLSRASGVQPGRIEQVVYDQACKVFTPWEGGGSVDLMAEVMFAYSDEFLYTFFRVQDEQYVPHATVDPLIFLGDAPQLILDTKLEADFQTTVANEDDIELDFHPGFLDGFVFYSPFAAYWNLGQFLQSGKVGEASRLEQAIVISTVYTPDGYAMEAAIPWEVIGVAGKPGSVFGVAASVSDNDTPGTDVQECMISSAPNRDFRDPTTWGTLFLMALP